MLSGVDAVPPRVSTAGPVTCQGPARRVGLVSTPAQHLPCTCPRVPEQREGGQPGLSPLALQFPFPSGGPAGHHPEP